MIAAIASLVTFVLGCVIGWHVRSRDVMSREDFEEAFRKGGGK